MSVADASMASITSSSRTREFVDVFAVDGRDEGAVETLE